MSQANAPHLPDTALGVLAMFEVSQTGIDVFSDQLIQAVKEGEVDPLELRARVKTLEMICERVNKATQKEQLAAADKYAVNEFEAFGVKFLKAAVHTSYEYRDCNDPVYVRMLALAEAAVKEVEERKEFLKAVKGSTVIVDEETGEAVRIISPVKKQVPGLKLFIK